jgi:hypothetical protein
MPIAKELAGQIDVLCEELDRRTARHNLVKSYVRRTEGGLPVPRAVAQMKRKNSYRDLMSISTSPWGKLIVNSKLDRLEVTGIDTGDKDADARIWRDVWQANAMDLESRLAHRAALLDGRSHAVVWADADGNPEVSLDDVTQMVVQYREGSRRHRVAALRRWAEGDETFATLFRPDGIFKVRLAKTLGTGRLEWQPRDVPGETWPLANALGVVPVVELALNRELAAGGFAEARGEFEEEIGALDRINAMTFVRMVVAFWMGFPLRGVVGDKILRDDDGVALPPFEASPDSVMQFEDPQAKLVEFKAADISNLSIFDELAQLASATSTPRHYFPSPGAIANVSAETIRALEGPLHATVNGSHKPSLGEGWEEVNRLGGKIIGVDVPPWASTQWADHESRSLAERADAFLKLSQGSLPWAASAELALNLTQEQIRRYEAEQAGSAFATLLTAAQEPVAEEPPVPASNGDVPPA